ncbi:MAG: flagellar filament capping protein FliD [Gammaproteobacteria bacterium]|nr:flagellar filament capping protein FliD [Gammaproteobacteria bacterium]
MDTGSVVDALVSASKTPIESSIYEKKQKNNATISALGKLKSALSDLKSATEGLSDEDTLRSVTAKSSNDAVTITASSSGFRGAMNITLTEKATTHRLASRAATDSTSDLGGGSMTLSNASGDSFIVPITSDESSLDEIAKAINEDADNFGVLASVVRENDGQYRLMLSAEDTGTANALTLSIADSDGDLGDGTGLSSLLDTGTGAFEEISAAKDAILDMDGLTITRSSNVIDDVFEGVELDFRSADKGASTVMTVTEDRQGKLDKVDEFVDSYNAFRKTLNGLMGENGALRGDSIARTLASSVRGAFTSASDAGVLGTSRLFDIGIAIDRFGDAEIDRSKLNDALDADSDVLLTLFSGEGGIASKLVEQLESHLDSENGSFQLREDSIIASQEQLDGRLEDLNRRMEAYEARLRAQFTSMEQMISKFNTLGSFVSSLPTISYSSS